MCMLVVNAQGREWLRVLTVNEMIEYEVHRTAVQCFIIKMYEYGGDINVNVIWSSNTTVWFKSMESYGIM